MHGELVPSDKISDAGETIAAQSEPHTSLLDGVSVSATVRSEVDVFQFSAFRRKFTASRGSFVRKLSHLNWIDLEDGRYVLNTCNAKGGQIIITETEHGGIK